MNICGYLSTRRRCTAIKYRPYYVCAQHALKVDVTSLVNKATRRPIVVVVASDVTRSRDVVKMVVQKLGIDRQKVSLMQLVAVIDYNKSHTADDGGKQTHYALPGC